MKIRPIKLLLMFSIFLLVDTFLFIIVNFIILKIVLGICLLFLIFGVVMFFISGIRFKQDSVIFKCLVASNNEKYNASVLKKLSLKYSDVTKTEIEESKVNGKTYKILIIYLKGRKQTLEILLRDYTEKQIDKIVGYLNNKISL